MTSQSPRWPFGVPGWLVALLAVPLIFSIWSVDLIRSVSRLRTSVEHDVAATAGLGRLERRLAVRDDRERIDNDLHAVVRLIDDANAASPEPRIDVSGLRPDIGDRELVDAVAAATAAVRARLTRTSTTLGTKWQQLDGLAAGAVVLAFAVCALLVNSNRAVQERQRLVEELQQTLSEVKALQRILPICTYCSRIRDDQNYWLEVEQYITLHSGARFSHSVCPACYERVVEPEFKGLEEI